jgi:hypothetical protein
MSEEQKQKAIEVAKEQTQDLLEGCDDQYPEGVELKQPEHFRIPVAELPSQKVYGPMDPLVGSMVEFFDVVIERGNDSLYKN